MVRSVSFDPQTRVDGRTLFHERLLTLAHEGRVLDAVSEGWDLLQFAPTDDVRQSEVDTWNEVAAASDLKSIKSAFVSKSSFATAIVSWRNVVTACDPSFALWLGQDAFKASRNELSALARNARAGRNARTLLYDVSGRPILVIALSAHQALNWPVSDLARAALQADEVCVALIAYSPSRDSQLESHARTAFNLTVSEARLAAAMLVHDRLEDAADHIGIGVQTAQGYRKSIFRKSGAKRRGDLVRLLLELSGRERPAENALIEAATKDMFGFTDGELALINQLTFGATVSEAALKLGLNVHTARDRMDQAFAKTETAKQADLVRLVCEFRALMALSQTGHIGVEPDCALVSGTRIIARDDGSLIYLGDYGPRKGEVVIGFHAGLGTRRVAPQLLRAMAKANLRLIMIERPGTGGTDMRAGPAFERSSADVIEVMDQLGVKSALLLSIAGGSASALTFAKLHPERVRAGLLVNPAPPPEHDRASQNPGGALRQMVFRNPALVRAMIKTFRNQTSIALIDRLLDHYFAPSRADRAALADPEIRALQRTSTQASTARSIDGIVGEMEAFAAGWSVPHLACGPWTVAVGTEDHASNWRMAADVWADLPGLNVEPIENAGRMIFASQPQAIVDCLLALAKAAPPPAARPEDLADAANTEDRAVLV